MPQGNAHALPPGIWFQGVYERTTITKLFMRSLGKAAIVSAILYGVYLHRSIQWHYSANAFVGKTISLGKKSTVNHRQLSTEEIDRLLAEQKAKKLAKLRIEPNS